MKRSILVIPPSGMTFRTYKRRQSEIARHLTEFYRVYYLSWQVSERRGLLSRAKVTWQDFFRNANIYREGNLNLVQLPMLRGPFKMTEIYNQTWLSKFIESLSLDFVFSASTFLHPLPKRDSLVYCYDFRDIPTTEMDNFLYRRRIQRHVREEIRKADLLTAVSYRLVEYVKREYGQPAYYLPNGVDMAEFEEVSQEEIDGIRERFGLGGKLVIGYIGYFGGWSGLDFAIEVFKKFRDYVKDTVLFVVGSGEEVERCKGRGVDGVVFTGAVDQTEVPKYVRSMDVGILTSPLVGFRDFSFPIKVIEYSAARKMVVSTPIAELRRIKLPNVLLAEFGSIDAWVSTLREAMETPWDPGWNTAIREYDWRRICEKLRYLLETGD